MLGVSRKAMNREWRVGSIPAIPRSLERAPRRHSVAQPVGGTTARHIEFTAVVVNLLDDARRALVQRFRGTTRIMRPYRSYRSRYE
jgi:hypothetical protein